MYTILGVYNRQKRKKNNKKDFVIHEVKFDELYIGEMENLLPANEAKGLLLVDKKDRRTSFYLDADGNGKLSKKYDFFVASDPFEKALYKSKKGSVHATNSDEAMIDALTGLIGGPPSAGISLDANEGVIITNKQGSTIDLLALQPGGEGLSPVMCMMNPQLVKENENTFERWQNRCLETGFELF